VVGSKLVVEIDLAKVIGHAVEQATPKPTSGAKPGPKPPAPVMTS
jgi:hypothetical protein